MNYQKNIFAVSLFLAIVFLAYESYQLFLVEENFFTGNSIITSIILLNSVLYFVYFNEKGELKFRFLDHFLVNIYPYIFTFSLFGFLLFIIFQTFRYGFLTGNMLYSQIFTFVVVLFSIVVMLLFFKNKHQTNLKSR